MDKLAEPRRRLGYYEKRAILELCSPLYSWKRSLSMTDKPINSKDNIEEILAEMDRLKKENKYLSKAVSTLTIDKGILTDAIEILKKKSQQRALLKEQKKS